MPQAAHWTDSAAGRHTGSGAWPVPGGPAGVCDAVRRGRVQRRDGRPIIAVFGVVVVLDDQLGIARQQSAAALRVQHNTRRELMRRLATVGPVLEGRRPTTRLVASALVVSAGAVAVGIALIACGLAAGLGARPRSDRETSCDTPAATLRQPV